MPTSSYKHYANIQIEGNEFYIGAVARCLNKIAAQPDGQQFLTELNSKGHRITITQTTGRGNSCRAHGAGVSPLLLQAIDALSDDRFRNELKAAIGTAKQRGITLEHLGRQLAEGLSPATYRTAQNIGKPVSKIADPANATGAQVMALHAHKAMQAMGFLQELMDGRRGVRDLPTDWDYELPRLLREHLTPGRGGASTIKFDPADTKPCATDPAMRNRPPALGLVHEMIHAWHNATGRSMRLAIRNRHKLEEVITTGMPPYQFETFSDNKFRALWTQEEIALRMRY